MSSQKTSNLNMHKWAGTDYVSRVEFNENFDTLDTEVSKTATQTQDGRMSKTDKAKLDGIENGAEVNAVDSVNGKTGEVSLTASDVNAASSTDFNAHLAQRATPTKLGHVKAETDTEGKLILPEVKVDDVTVFINDNGELTTINPDLIAGNSDAGYMGTIPANEFITGDQLASEIGLTAGTSQHSNVDWLRFMSGGKEINSPMKSIRYGLTWDDIDAVNAVYGDRTIVINGLTYKVRLWRGAVNDPSNYEDDDRDAIGSEWNKLMLPIHENAPNNWAYSEYGGTTEDWGINFTDEDLLTHSDYGDGSYTWCQETRGDNTSYRVYRGRFGVSGSDSSTSSYSTSRYGWRPVLELVE